MKMLEATKVKLIKAKLVQNIMIVPRLINPQERLKLNLKLAEQDGISKELFKKKVRICLKRLINSETKSKEIVKKIGKAAKWEKDNRNDDLKRNGEELKMIVEIYVRKVKWKKKRTQAMHRKTVWKGKEVMIILKKTYHKENPELKYDVKLDRWRLQKMMIAICMFQRKEENQKFVKQ
jgi:hypothetical protein